MLSLIDEVKKRKSARCEVVHKSIVEATAAEEGIEGSGGGAGVCVLMESAVRSLKPPELAHAANGAWVRGGVPSLCGGIGVEVDKGSQREVQEEDKG